MPPRAASATGARKKQTSPCQVLVGRILYAASLLPHQKSQHHLKKSDLQTLAHLNAQPEKRTSGGSPHLPSEYFGQASGQYYSVPGFPSEHTVYTSSPILARDPLIATGFLGGAHHTVTVQHIKECVAEHDKSLKVDDDALKLMRDVVASTLSPSMTAAQAKVVTIGWSKAAKKTPATAKAAKSPTAAKTTKKTK